MRPKAYHSSPNTVALRISNKCLFSRYPNEILSYRSMRLMCFQTVLLPCGRARQTGMLVPPEHLALALRVFSVLFSSGPSIRCTWLGSAQWHGALPTEIQFWELSLFLDPASQPSLWQLGLTWSPSLMFLDLVISRHGNEVCLLRLRDARMLRQQTLHSMLSVYFPIISFDSHIFQSAPNPQRLDSVRVSYCTFSHSFQWSQVHFSHSQQNCKLLEGKIYAL